MRLKQLSLCHWVYEHRYRICKLQNFPVRRHRRIKPKANKITWKNFIAVESWLVIHKFSFVMGLSVYVSALWWSSRKAISFTRNRQAQFDMIHPDEVWMKTWLAPLQNKTYFLNFTFNVQTDVCKIIKFQWRAQVLDICC